MPGCCCCCYLDLYVPAFLSAAVAAAAFRSKIKLERRRNLARSNEKFEITALLGFLFFGGIKNKKL